MIRYIAIILLIVLTALYYAISFEGDTASQTFITISTFLFAIFTGFFISRQGGRYSNIRDVITQFDGEMSSMYRQCGHLGPDLQARAGDIIKDHYNKILSHHAWDYHFVNPSNTITSLHLLMDEVKGKALPSTEHLAVQRVLTSLEQMQIMRKKMVALQAERIPKFQWFLVYFLAAILVVTVSAIPGEGFWLGPLLKAAFSSAVVIVIILLHQFDSLKFFENTIGEHSAQDVLDILANKK